MKLDFNDLLIVPKDITPITTRSIIDPFIKNYLPLMTAPMDTVVNEINATIYFANRIITCLPRGVKLKQGFKSFSILEVEKLFNEGNLNPNGKYLIDVANGHMENILSISKDIKEKYPNLKLMVGNIANPKSFENLSNVGVDFIRIGIGAGAGCLTTKNTGVGYPMASLIKECYAVSVTLKKPAYIVADGGMQGYADIIKALALGADYVMLGSVFNKALESAGPNYLWRRIRVSQKVAEKAYKYGIPVYKKFRGMSTKEVQRKWGAKIIKTSEGVIRYRKVEYTLAQWCENFEHYLRSAMSYTGSHNLKEFVGNVNLIQITDNAYKRFDK